MSASTKSVVSTQKKIVESGQSEKLARTDVPVFDAQTTYARLLLLSETQTTRKDFLLSLLQHGVSASNAQGGAYFVPGDSGQLKLGPRLMSRELVYKVPAAMEKINDLALECIHKGYSMSSKLDKEGTIQAVLSPVNRNDQVKEVLCLVFDRRVDVAMRSLYTQLLAGYVNLWEKTSITRALLQESAFTSGLIETISALNSTTDKGRAYVNLTAQLKSLTGADRVAVGLRKKSKTEFNVVQLSDTDEINARGEFARLLELCFDETSNYGKTAHWPSVGAEWERNIFGGHKRFFEFVEGKYVLSVPLMPNEENCIGVITLWWIETQPNPQVRMQMEAASVPLGAAVDALTSSREGRVADVLLGKKASRSKLYMLLFIATLIGAMFIPISHRITSDVVIEPVKQRVISTAFDAVLESVVAKPGDIVRKDDLLASFDGRELNWQLDSLTAEMESARKTKDLKLAERDTQGAQIARLDMERITLQIDLLNGRISNLEVRSPIDGIVISGDLEQRQGSVISKGRPLFEVAPLDAVNAEIRISSMDYRHIEAGLPVEISLEALPELSWSETLSSIQPRAVVVDAETVFISKITLDNPNQLIYPGMRGKAAVVKEERPLGWILFHRAYEQLSVWARAKFGW